MKTLMKNRLLFIFLALFTILVIIFISYRYFLTSFTQIEKEINKRNINSVITIVNNNLKSLENIITDYAKWDDTYNYIKTQNNEYIYENFREGANTLEDLELDFMIFTNLKNKKLYSNVSESSPLFWNEKVQQNLLNKFKARSGFSSLYKNKSVLLNHKNIYLLITKVTISNSDNTRPTIGFLYGGKVISNEILNSMNEIFKKISLTDKVLDNDNVTIDSEILKNIRIHTVIDEECNCIKNTIQFYNYKNEFVFSIVTNTKRDLIDIGKEAIYSYNLIIGGFLIVVSFLLYKNHMFLKSYNQRLLRDVEKKTKDLKKVNKKLKMISETDELTKINNRRRFFDLGFKALKKSILSSSDLCIVMIDIDDFKKINDTYGHDIGDKVLIQLSSILSAILDEKHIFGRLGGEEFAIVLVDMNLEDAFNFAEIIRKNIANAEVCIEDKRITYTISSGIAHRENRDCLDEILKEADTLLYKSKKSGKNKCSIRDRKTIS